MKFERINKNVIRCELSREEMSVRGLRIEDIMDDRAKAEEFLQYILASAKYELDFAIDGDLLNVQLSVLNDGGISLMISDDQNATIRIIAEQFNEKLRELSVALMEAKKAHEKLNNKNDTPTQKVIKYFVSSEENNKNDKFLFWSRLGSIDECIKLSKALGNINESESVLYKYFDDFFLSVSLCMNKSEVAKNVFIMSEYSDEVSAETSEYLMIKEHGDVIIKDNALEKLRVLG